MAAASSSAASASSSPAMLQSCCVYAFDTIVAAFDTNLKPVPPPATEKFPLFVTWKKLQSDDTTTHLRGCIGTFAPLELAAGIKKYAHISAFSDSRFKPVTAAEIPRLICHVSVLTDFEPASNCYDWTVGVHGIQIDFSASVAVGKSSKSSELQHFNATYLPEVAKEQGWTIAETITELVAKSGYTGPVTDQLRAAIKLTRYQSKKASLTYAQYIAIRKPAAASKK